MIKLLWHVYWYGHGVRVNRTMTVGAHDIGSKGWLYSCECGLVEAR